jgi:hypothetical protein
MTPNEKADFLIKRSRWYLTSFDNEDALEKITSKNIALFIVDTILNTLPTNIHIDLFELHTESCLKSLSSTQEKLNNLWLYWIEVEKEIKKL